MRKFTYFIDPSHKLLLKRFSFFSKNIPPGSHKVSLHNEWRLREIQGLDGFGAARWNWQA
jgi:hypothetical protein